MGGCRQLLAAPSALFHTVAGEGGVGGTQIRPEACEAYAVGSGQCT